MPLDENQRRTLQLLRQKQGGVQEERQELERLPTREGPRNISELTGGFVSRPLFTGTGSVVGTALGATGGGALGLAGGPAAPGTVPSGAVIGGLAGGGLGAAFGSSLFDNVNNLAFQAGLVTEPTGGLESALTALEEGAFDFATGAFFQVFRPTLIRRAIMGKIFGVASPEAKQAARLAELAGVTVETAQPGVIRRGLGAVSPGQVAALGAADIGGQAPKVISKALSVFPITGTPARRNLLAKQGAVLRRIGETIDLLAPNSILRNAAGLDIAQAATERFSKVNRIAGRLYDRSFNLMRQAVDAQGNQIPIVPTTETKKVATDFAQAISSGQIQLLTGDQLAPAVRDEVGTFITQLQNLPENLTADQYKGLVRQFRLLLDNVEGAVGKGASFREAAIIKEALEADFRNLDVSRIGQDLGDLIIRSQRAADGFYSRMLQRFQTTTGKKFGRVDRNIFGSGTFRAGNLNADQTLDVVLNLKSQQAVKELGEIIGPRALKQAGRTVLERAVQLSTDRVNIGGTFADRLNPTKLLQTLGASGKQGTEEGLRELLQQSGIKFDDFVQVLKAAEALQDIADPSTFVARRVILGGAPAITGALGAGAAFGAGAGAAASGGAGVVSAVATTLLFRRLTDIATSPESLKLMQIALDEAASTAARQKALGAVVVSLGRQEAERRRVEEANRQTARVNRFALRGSGQR